jgi:tetratricopeptide (TPR) repeat protein
MFRSKFTSVAVLALATCATVPLLGFQSSGGTAGGGGSRPTSSGSSPSISVPNQRQQNTPTFQRPIFIMGKVAMEDGSPLPQRVAIRRTCQGTSTRRETYTDSRGTFSFQIGGIQAMQFAPDAADSSAGVTPTAAASGDPLSQSFGGSSTAPSSGQSLEQQIWSCEIMAELPGYRSDAVSLAGRHTMDDPDIGTIVLHRIGAVSGSMVSVTSMQAPKQAHKEFQKARELMGKGKVPEAQALAEKAVSDYPHYAEALYLLGQAHEKQKEIDQAHTAYTQSMQADPKFMPPYLSLAQLAGVAKDWQEAEKMSSKVMELDGVDFPQAYFINGVANYNLGKFDVAEKSVRRAEQLDSQHYMPRIQLLLGTLLERKRDYAGAAAEYRSYLKLSPQAENASDVQKQLAQLEKATSALAAPAAAAGAPPTAGVPQNPPRQP